MSDDLNDFNAAQARQNAEDSRVSYDKLLHEVLFAIKAASLNGENSIPFQYVKSSVKTDDLNDLQSELTRREFTVTSQEQDSLFILNVSY